MCTDGESDEDGYVLQAEREKGSHSADGNINQRTRFLKQYYDKHTSCQGEEEEERQRWDLVCSQANVKDTESCRLL